MTLACVSLCVLALAGALLHLASWLALAALFWALSGASAFVVGWYVAERLESTLLGVAAGVIAAALMRFALLRLWAWFVTPRSLTLITWRQA
ncbi:MAG TPA: hypothetical protein VEA80_12425 [Vitreimonas sp.]|uniref:hypothetical protein n=1 Tax=Vitreimonas sp. TaxID=3069702 RepID=UPI002D38AF13|nr:hypothetical protein [Vitreimonas sp.]HYD88277.1 hypothetical protein [Vitreimonas sp.]